MQIALLIIFMQAAAFAMTGLLGLLTGPASVAVTVFIGIFGAFLAWTLTPITSKLFR